MLNETVGMHRMVACIVGFIGTLLVIQPSFAEVGTPALLPLFVAVDFALFMLVTRQLAKHVDPISLQTSSGAMATVVLSVIYIAFLPFDHFDLSMVMPDTIEIILLIAIGFLGTMAHLLMTWSLRFAPSATLAPMQYLEIPIATIIGFIVFADLPNGLAAVGIVITILAGLYVVYREHRAGKALST